DGRKCGECTACCKTHGVGEIQKPGGTWCEHCQIGKGCGIYATRPTSCQQYRCVWLAGFGLDEHRPDKKKIVQGYKRVPGLGVCLWLYEVEEGALDSEFSRMQLRRANLATGNAVLEIPLSGEATLYVPEEKEGLIV